MARAALLIVLIAVIAVLSVVFARPLLGLPAGSPNAARPSPSPTPAATPSVGFIPAPTPTASRSASPAATPNRTPTASCPPVPRGGRSGGFRALFDVRVAHQPGFDRVVFDFGQDGLFEHQELPAYSIERASTFTDTAGRPVRVEGGAAWRIRFEGASTASEGRVIARTPLDLDPTTPLVRDVKLVDDFEAVMVWAVGLERLECPQVTTLKGPIRLVLDLPTPP